MSFNPKYKVTNSYRQEQTKTFGLKFPPANSPGQVSCLYGFPLTKIKQAKQYGFPKQTVGLRTFVICITKKKNFSIIAVCTKPLRYL